MENNDLVVKNVVLNERIDQAVKQVIERYKLSPSKGYSPALRIIAERGIDAMEAKAEAVTAAGS